MGKKHVAVRLVAGLLLAGLLAGCQTAAYQQAQLQDSTTGRLTLGTVQRSIKVGMSSAAVATALGSPNIVTTDEQHREVWVYDKIATDSAYSNSNSGVGTMLAGLGAGFLGWTSAAAGGAGAGGGLVSSSGASSTSQRTLTVIVKFDQNGKVRDYAYNTSRF